MKEDLLLKIENLAKSFNGVPVLTDVSLELRAGHVLGLIGENGAGKSTLAKCVSGIHKPDGGKITLNASSYTVPQEFLLADTLTVTENIFLGRETHTAGFLRTKHMLKAAAGLLAEIDSSIPPDKLCSALSVAEKQKVEIAKALLSDAKILIMDEPTTVLSHAETEKLFAIIRDFTSHGGGVIYVSHKLTEVKEICSEICVLRDGMLVKHFPSPENVTPRELASAMVGRELSGVFPPRTAPAPDAEEILRLESVSSLDAVKNVSFSLRKGEIFGLAGLAGSGRTELCETISSLRRRTGGGIVFKGVERDFLTPGEAFRNGISYLSEDRQGTALLTSEGIMENVTLSSLDSYSCAGFIRDDARLESALKYISAFMIKCADPFMPVKSLSGGNQQKAAIAKGLDTHPELFMFDEPTRGVDVGARSEIYSFIRKLAESGVTCILVSSDLEELTGNCHRIGVMREGELAGILCEKDFTEEKIMYLATGTDKQ